MKKVLMPVANGGTVWLVTHRLSLASERNLHIRAIHIWTFLGAHVLRHANASMNTLFWAIENKLYGVRLARSRLEESLSCASDPCYAHSNIQDYGGEQRVIFDVEAYLNTIYSTLEIVAEINRRLDTRLPHGFRSQSKKGKFHLFEFSHWPWLPLFYDLRILFSHYSSSFPLLKQRSFLFDVENPNGLLVFTKKGQQSVEYEAVLSFADKLVSLLDVWALFCLQDVDPDAKTWQIHSRNFVGPLKGRSTTARPFLVMARRFQRLVLQSTKDERLRSILTSIKIRT